MPDSLPRMIGAPGRAGNLGAAGQTMTARLKLDFENAPDDEYFEFIEQAQAVIGMRSVDSLEYAPHALQQVWSNPDNLAPHSNDFLNSSWIKQGSPVVVIRQINESEFQFDQVSGSSDLVQIIERGAINQTYTSAYFFPDQDNDALPAWLRIIELSVLDGQDRYEAWYRVADKTVGTIQPGANGGNAIAAGWDRDDVRGGWWFYLTGHTTIHSNVSTSISTAIADGSTTRDAGSQFIFRDCWIYPGTKTPTAQMASGSPYVETGNVGALDNWQSSASGKGEVWSLAYSPVTGRPCYMLDAREASGGVNKYCNGITPAQIPTSLRVRAWTDPGETADFVLRTQQQIGSGLETTIDDVPRFYELKSTRSSGGGELTIQTSPGSRVYFDFPEKVEGPELFGLKTVGANRYLLRRKQGVGAQLRPQIENECANYNMAPQDFTGLVFGGNAENQKIVQRGELYGNLTQEHWDTVEAADPKGNGLSFIYFESPSGYSNVDMVGPCGSTADYAFTCYALGSGTPDMGPTDTTRIPFPLDGTFQREDVKAAANAGTSYMRIGLNGAGWILVGFNQMNVGDPVAIIPISGSARIQLEDRPVTTVEACGIDPGRNSTLDSRFDNATLGDHPSPGTIPGSAYISTANGWNAEIVGKGKTARGSYIDIRCHGNATGSFWISNATSTEIAAATGQEWLTAFDVSLLSGDISGLEFMALTIAERDAAGAFLAATAIGYANLIGSTPRRFYVSRSFTDASTAHMNGYLEIRGTGTFDFVIRIADWSNQHSTILYPHKETTGTAIEFQQWIDGLTIQERWDVDARISDEAWSFWEMYGSDRGQNRIQLIADEGGADPDFPRLQWVVDGQGGATRSIVHPSSVIGENTIQSAFADGDEELWVNSVSGGTRTTGLPSDLSHICIGNRTAASRSRNGVCQSLTFVGERLTAA